MARGQEIDNYSRTIAVPSTNITSGNTVHDERTLGELREQITSHWSNYVSADSPYLDLFPSLQTALEREWAN